MIEKRFPEVGKNGVIAVFKENDYPEQSFRDRTIDMFDFPCSPTFAEFYQERYGYPTKALDRARSDKVEYREPKPITKSDILNIVQQAKLQSQENRRELQKHFKHHSYLNKKKVKKYD